LKLDKPNFQLFAGEKLLAVARNVTHICPFDGPVFGSLFVTNYKVVFENADSKAKRTTDVRVLFP